MWYGWLVAQELQQQAAILGKEILAPLSFWENKKHEIDFVVSDNEYLEIRKGGSSAVEFSWFPHQFPNKKLIVMDSKRFETEFAIRISFEEFLLSVDEC